MRRLILSASVFVVAACGGSAPTTTPPPPPPSGNPPASVAIQAGDGQQAEPAAAVATRPSVIVRDASGAPVSGVTVTFAVDSGGGSLSATTAVTGSDGIATAGTWTLGTVEGRNTIKATVGALAPVKIAATAVISGATFPTTTIGTGGGSISVIQPGPLNGFSITVPGGAFSTSLTATVSYASNASIPRTATMNPVSPLITISTATTDFASVPLTIHIAAVIPAGDFPVIVVYDRASGAKEILTTTKWDATGVTAVTTTLSSARLFGAASLREGNHGASLVSPGMDAVVSALPPAVLMADYDSGYLPGKDDWEFQTTQTELAAANQTINTIGSAATSLWYYATGAASRPKLNGRFMLQAGVPLSDRVGLRWAGVVGATFDANAVNMVRYAGQLVGTESDFDQNQFLLVRTKFASSAESGATPKPQLMEVVDLGTGSTFYLIAYRVSGTRIYVADPYVPGDAGRFLEFPAGAAMTPYTALTPGGQTFHPTRPTALGLSSLVSVDQFPATYAKVLDGSIGQGQFPNYEFRGWAGRLYDTLYLVDTLRWWVECPGCTFGKATSLSPAPAGNVAGGELFKFGPVQDLGSIGGNGYLASALPTAGTDYALGTAIGSAPFAQDATTRNLWVDWHPYVLRRLQTGILPAPLNGYAGLPFSMTFQVAQNLLPPHVNYVWDFGDLQPAVTVTVADNPAVQHTYAAVGTYQVTAKIVDTRNNQVIGQVTAPAKITVPQYAWQFTSVTLASREYPPGGLDTTDPTDQMVDGFFNTWVSSLHNSPGNSLLWLGSDGACRNIFLEMFPAGQFRPVIDSTGAAQFPAILGISGNCGADPDFIGSLVMGPLGNGTVVGSATDVPKPESLSLPGGSINATMTGTSLHGTFVWRARFSNGIGFYTFNFNATQVVPPP